MEIKDAATAREFVWSWLAAQAPETPYARQSPESNARRFMRTAHDLGGALAVMTAAPNRYGEITRANMRQAISVLRAAAAALHLPADKLPPLKGSAFADGYDGRYRVYTVELLPFDALPAYADGGPSKVVLDGWGVSFSRLCRALSSASVAAADDGMITLKVYEVRQGFNWAPCVPGDTRERHPLDGTKYATQRDADRAAYEAGLTGFMVYEKHAAGYGLPCSPAPVA